MNLKSLVMPVAAVLALAASAACAAPASDEPAAFSAQVAPAGAGPIIAFDKESVELRSVPLDMDALATFLVINRGDAPLRLGQPQVGAGIGGEAGGVGPEAKFEVAPGRAELLTVNVGRQSEEGLHTFAVTVPTNDPRRPAARLSVHARVMKAPADAGPGPRLRLDKEMIFTGTVPYDWPLYEQFVLYNDGDELLVIESEPHVRVEEGC